ncbi:carboxypeptidase-like regulatory domain-containing protein [Winogradskyella maritima]|uniref:Carboxypeptidase-like regulatory domain-containing protein n=1 Tax=Winogradskyella maritima TaxID=1517766 RepID=A0ABV8AFE0_9FLAO|nr:carboxypeptidase-like regulatory domain-containing protein [Winogradskyella maritima]
MKTLQIVTAFLCVAGCISAQTLKGVVTDALTKQPLETVSIYFNNTTIGTTTDSNGEFSITYTDVVQSPLIISYLGYEKIIIDKYRGLSSLKIELKEKVGELDEVVINTDDGLTRKQKLRIFREQFLGTSNNANKCKILNEDDLILRYNKREKQLSVSAVAPLDIENKALGYTITYELVDFEVVFNYVDKFRREFNVFSTFYSGTSLYKDENFEEKERVLKKREKAFNGSIQHFMRSLYNGDLKAENYRVFKKGLGVNQDEHIFIRQTEDEDFKEVKLSGKLAILYKGRAQSDIIPQSESFYVDAYGNFLPVRALFFNGAMGSQRLGDTLPLDYGL